MLLGETLSLIFGMSNLVIWFGIAIPQIYKNYKYNSSNALSYLFYYKLLIGGVISLSIALIKKTSITVIYVSVHHLIITSILMSQLLYYRIVNKRSLSNIETKVSLIVTPVICILLSVVSVTKNVVLIEILAWVANMLFTTSKFNQIYINYKNKSTRGLSKFAFVCMIFTDLCYLTSVLVNGIDRNIVDIINQNSPWLFSCTISLISGTVILFQFVIYKDNYIVLSDEDI